MISSAILFIVSFLVLVRASSLIVNALVRIGRFLALSEYTIAFLLMASATSIPELFIALNSGLFGLGQLSFGNILGANILNITLVVGVVAIFSRKKSFVIPPEVKKDAWLAWIVAMLPIFLIFDGSLDRFDGLMLVVVYVLYIVFLFQRRSTLNNPFIFNGEISGFRIFIKDLFLFFIGVVLLLISAGFIVFLGSGFGSAFSIDPILIGIVVVALGTTMPELVFGVRSLSLHHGSLVSGNAIGSVVVNSTLVLGVLALLSPIHIVFTGFLIFTVIFLAVSLWIFALVMSNEQGIVSRRHALLLLGLYVVFVILLYSFSF